MQVTGYTYTQLQSIDLKGETTGYTVTTRAHLAAGEALRGNSSTQQHIFLIN